MSIKNEYGSALRLKLTSNATPYSLYHRLTTLSSAWLLLTLFAISLIYSSTSLASVQQNSRALLLISQNTVINREEAVAIAKQGRESKVLKVKQQESSSGTFYYVKLLTKEGRVKQVVVNASTGQIESRKVRE